MKCKISNTQQFRKYLLYDQTFAASGRGAVLETTVTKPGDRTGAHWGPVREGERDQSKTSGWGR